MFQVVKAPDLSILSQFCNYDGVFDDVEIVYGHLLILDVFSI